MGSLEIGSALQKTVIPFESDVYKELTDLIARNSHWQEKIIDPENKNNIIDNPITKRHLFWEIICEWLANNINNTISDKDITQKTINIRTIGHTDAPYNAKLNVSIYKQAVKIIGNDDEFVLWSKINDYITSLTGRLKQCEHNQEMRSKERNSQRDLSKQMIKI